MWKSGILGVIALLVGATVTPSGLAAQQAGGGNDDGDRVVRERARRMMVRAPRAALGVEVEAEVGSDDDMAGVRVVRVPEGSAADDAGVQDGDIIIAIDDEDLSDTPVRSLLEHLSDREPGDVVTLSLQRAGEEVETEVTLQEAPGRMGVRMRTDPPPAQRERVERALDRARREVRDRDVDLRELERSLRDVRVRVEGSPFGSWFQGCRGLRHDGEPFVVPMSGCIGGAEVHALNPGLESYFGASTGVLVLEAAEGAVLGVEAGDVIRAVDGREVEDPADLRRILRSYEEGDELELDVLRDGRTLSVPVTVP